MLFRFALDIILYKFWFKWVRKQVGRRTLQNIDCLLKYQPKFLTNYDIDKIDQHFNIMYSVLVLGISLVFRQVKIFNDIKQGICIYVSHFTRKCYDKLDSVIDLYLSRGIVDESVEKSQVLKLLKNYKDCDLRFWSTSCELLRINI